MGVLHPEVMRAFQLDYPTSALELEFDLLFAHFLGQTDESAEPQQK
jgi:phenylalanyl-tRNA synthetase beta subunit